MARAGLLALEFYSPDTKSWRQVCLFSFGYLYIRSFFVGFSWDSYMHMCLLTLYITCEAIFPGIFVAQTQNRGSSFFAFVWLCFRLLSFISLEINFSCMQLSPAIYLRDSRVWRPCLWFDCLMISWRVWAREIVCWIWYRYYFSNTISLTRTDTLKCVNLISRHLKCTYRCGMRYSKCCWRRVVFSIIISIIIRTSISISMYSGSDIAAPNAHMQARRSILRVLSKEIFSSKVKGMSISISVSMYFESGIAHQRRWYSNRHVIQWVSSHWITQCAHAGASFNIAGALKGDIF